MSDKEMIARLDQIILKNKQLIEASKKMITKTKHFLKINASSKI